MKATVFYSWQSDLPLEHGKDFLRSALQEAIDRLSEDANLVVRPELDYDTQGIPGSPAMVAAILRKIDECSVFVGDVSLTYVRHGDGSVRRAPNPNVLLELGYALKRLSNERVLLLANIACAPPEQLPFNLRGNRVIEFDPTNDRTELVGELRHALHLIMTRAGLPPDYSTPVEIILTREDLSIESALHKYRLPIKVRNLGAKIIADWTVELTFPRAVLDADKTYPIVRDIPETKMVVMRQTQQTHSAPLYPGEVKEVLGIDYHMDGQLYDKRGELFKRDVAVSFYVGAERVVMKSVIFRDLQSF